jgi:AcrR family transcriptional regulator
MVIVAPRMYVRRPDDRPESLYPKLPPGRTKRSPEETARNHRGRLMGAMIEAVARNGYSGTTLRELVALAGVSNTTFYEQFDSVQDCFLATHDAIVNYGIEQMERAYRSESSPRKQLKAAFQTYVDLVIDEPASTHFVVVESLRLGAAGVAHRQRESEAIERMLHDSAARSPENGEVSEITVRAIVGGIRGVVQRRVRSGHAEELRNYVDELLDWGFSYQRPGGTSAWHLPQGEPSAETAKEREHAADEELWDERPDSIRSRATLTQHERIVRAVAMVAAERGYAKLSIPAITGAAGVSNQTFYEQFTSAQDAFLEALDILGRRGAARIAAAMEVRETWTDAIIAGLEELLAYLAEKPLVARLPFIEAISAGSEGLDRVWMLIDSLIALFNPSSVPAEVGSPLPAVVVEAISCGIYVVIQHEVAQGRTEALPELLPDAAFIALAPFGAE